VHGSTFALNSKKLKVHRPLFSDIVSKYLEDCSNTHGTRFHKENTYLLFKQIMGDLVFKEIGIAEARKFKSCLSKIPANAKKRLNLTSFENLDFDKLKGKAQHPKTINNRLAYLIALFTWAIRAGYYHGQNPFSNLIIRGQKVSASTKTSIQSRRIESSVSFAGVHWLQRQKGKREIGSRRRNSTRRSVLGFFNWSLFRNAP
jgi:hypothetical protein